MELNNIQQIKEQIPIADFLHRLGHRPEKSNEKRSLYFSMIRDDGKHPSFYIYHHSELWRDYGLGKWGSVIDLAMEIYHTDSFNDVIRHFNQLYNHGQPDRVPPPPKRSREPAPPSHEIVRILPLGNNPALTGYLKRRGVWEAALSSGLLAEIYYNHIRNDGTKKRYFAVGWQNLSGGWDTRSAVGKISLTPKDVLYRSGSTNRAVIFEGMMDYLSALTENPALTQDHLYIMNSTGHSWRVMDKLTDQADIQEIDLYLDNGNGGRHFTTEFMAEFAYARDMAYLYDGYDDYNEKIKAGLESGSGQSISTFAQQEATPDERRGMRR